ncbi:unnamed protein product [Closterium sp. Naga37s-1]|nr:unnamed protein product [Closterium sp. Naga37s-1]
MTPGESAQGSAGTPPATIGGPGSPWEFSSSAEATRTSGHGETTRRDHAEQEEDAAVHTEPTAARHQHLRSPFPQAAADLSAPGIRMDCEAGARREGRREQREELGVTPTPHVSDEAPSPRHQAYPEDGAPLRTALDALFPRDHNLPAARDAPDHLRPNAQATAGETSPADAGVQGNGPRDEESRAVDASRDVANAEAIEDGTTGVRANGDENEGERANGGGVTCDHANDSVTPRDEANAATAGQREDLPCGSPAYRRESQMNVGEGNAPGAPHPLRRSARRTPREQAPAEAGTGPRARSERAADLRNDGGSDPQTPAARQARSRQGAQEEVGGELDRSPRLAPRQELQGNSSVRREEGARTLSGRQVGGRTAGRGRRAAGRGGRARGGGPENVYQQAGRRALNEMSGDNETSTSDSSFVAAESTDSTSSSESLDDEQLQTPARAGRAAAAASHMAGGAAAPDDIGVIARAEGLARRGSLRRAVMALEATPVSTPSPTVLEALRAKHPPAPASPPDWNFPEPDPHLSAPFAVFSKVLGSCEMGVGAGPSGTTFEHLRDAALINHSVGKHLHALVNTILTGKLPPAVAELLTASRLIALSKPDGGTRPIAIGESITRLAAKTALTLTAGAARVFFLPHQFGVAVPGGAEAIIHITRTYLTVNTGALVLQADLANAFNSVNRDAIITSLRDSSLASLLPLVKLLYGLPSALCLDAGFSHPPLLSETGVRQGDPLGPLLFAAAIHPALTKTTLSFPSVVCLAYADDVTFLGDAAMCAAAFEDFTGNLGEIGLRHNPAKCAAWSQAGQQGAALPVGVPFTKDGVKVLGSFIGGSDATAAFLRASLDTMGVPLPLIARMEPQLASLLLSRCISRRIAYVARTTPLSALPVEEWSDWGKKLFETLLTACGIRHPRGEAEISRTWAQASLPISLGGLGLTDPSVEGRVGFLASYTQAQHLLTSIDESAVGALAETRVQMSEQRDRGMEVGQGKGGGIGGWKWNRGREVG